MGIRSSRRTTWSDSSRHGTQREPTSSSGTGGSCSSRNRCCGGTAPSRICSLSPDPRGPWKGSSRLAKDLERTSHPNGGVIAERPRDRQAAHGRIDSLKNVQKGRPSFQGAVHVMRRQDRGQGPHSLREEIRRERFREPPRGPAVDPCLRTSHLVWRVCP